MMTAVRQYMVFAHHETYQGGEMIMVSFFYFGIGIIVPCLYLEVIDTRCQFAE